MTDLGVTGEFDEVGSPTRPRLFVRILAALGTRTALLAGLYAWAVTVLPLAFDSKGGAACAIAACIVHVIATATGSPSRTVLLQYLFVGFSMLGWLTAPTNELMREMTTVRGVSGMVGWSLYVLAAAGAAPVAIPRSPLTPTKTASRTRRISPAIRAQVALYATVIGAIAIELVGWDTRGAEVAVLYRLLLIASSLALLSLAGPVALRIAARRSVKKRPKEKLPLPPVQKRR